MCCLLLLLLLLLFALLVLMLLLLSSSLLKCLFVFARVLVITIARVAVAVVEGSTGGFMSSG